MTTDYSKDLFDPEGGSARITLGFAEDVHLYTPSVDETLVVSLAEEFGVPPERIIAALKKWWFEIVQDQLNALDQRIGGLQYDTGAATHFAQRFL